MKFPATDIEFAMQEEINTLRSEVERLDRKVQVDDAVIDGLEARLNAAEAALESVIRCEDRLGFLNGATADIARAALAQKAEGE